MPLFIGIVTAVALATFIGIIVWAYSRGRAKANREAAMLPFAQPDEGQAQAGGDAGADQVKKEGESHE